jgi:hypothetical protein
MRAEMGGGGGMLPCPKSLSWRCQTNILGLEMERKGNIHITHNCIQMVTKTLQGNARNVKERSWRRRRMKIHVGVVGEGA